MMGYPILYSFRRCPYAIAARMALWDAQIIVALREVNLRNKPQELCALFEDDVLPTVPVLLLSQDSRLTESHEICQHAFNIYLPSRYLAANGAQQTAIDSFIHDNNGYFKPTMYKYKYFRADQDMTSTEIEEQVEQMQTACQPWLARLEQALSQHTFLVGARASIADICLFPFMRQFSMIDENYWDSLNYPQTKQWLNHWLHDNTFKRIFSPRFAPWTNGDKEILFGEKVIKG